MNDETPEDQATETEGKVKTTKPGRDKRRRDVEDRVDAALSAIEDLSELLQEENEAVIARDDPAFFALQDEKVLLVEEYKKALTALEVRQADMVLLDPDLRAALKQSHAHLEKVFADNIHTLDIAQHATTRVIGIIIEAARKAVNPAERYDDDGALDPGSRGGPVGFDKTL